MFNWSGRRPISNYEAWMVDGNKNDGHAVDGYFMTLFVTDDRYIFEFWTKDRFPKIVQTHTYMTIQLTNIHIKHSTKWEWDKTECASI